MSSSRFNICSFILRLQKKVAPEFTLKQSTVDSVNGFVDFVCDKLLERIGSLQRSSGKITTDVETVQTAVRLLFPPSLSKFAISYATQSLLKYQQYLKKDSLEVKSVAVSSDAAGGSTSTSTAKNVRFTRSLKAGLILPTSRVDRCLKRVSGRVSPQASVFLTGVLEFLASELIESASEVTLNRKLHQISVNDLRRSILGDKTINGYLLSKKLSKKSKSTTAASSTTASSKSSSTVSKTPIVYGGDEELQILAREINWGVLRNSWKGLYTSVHTKKKLKVPVEAVANSELTAQPSDSVKTDSVPTSVADGSASVATPTTVLKSKLKAAPKSKLKSKTNKTVALETMVVS